MYVCRHPIYGHCPGGWDGGRLSSPILWWLACSCHPLALSEPCFRMSQHISVAVAFYDSLAKALLLVVNKVSSKQQLLSLKYLVILSGY
jgi:hypothetical protein